jgi:hypothetical protein
VTFDATKDLPGRPVSECGGRNANSRHFTLDGQFTLCGERVRRFGRDWGFESCEDCAQLQPHAERGMWFDYSKPGWVRLMRTVAA